MKLDKLDRILRIIHISVGLIFIYLSYNVFYLPVEIIVTVIFISNILVSIYRYVRKKIKEKKYK
ncbi:hypothetical protein QJR26_09720 [Clostridium baratii]